MYKKLMSILTIIVFMGNLVALLIVNFGSFKAAISSALTNNGQNICNGFGQVETNLKNEMPLKSLSHEVYGLGLRAMNKDMVGNNEYTKLSDGTVVMTNYINNVDSFSNGMIVLNELLMSKNIPLVYVQLPYRAMTPEESAVSRNDTLVSLLKGMCDSFKHNGIDVLDLNQSERIQSIDPVYLHSDIHASTEFEFASADIILNYLDNNYGIDFPEKEKVFDIDQYEIRSYPFYGNTTYNTGHFFSSEDVFNIYHPEYDTNMILYDYSDGTSKGGTYDQVCMNGYEDTEYTDKTYWITNYLRWPSPYYDLFNLENEESPNLLLICDSIYLRGCSFLALASNTVTVYDPRYDNGYYLDLALKSHDYDAVIAVGTVFYSMPLNVKHQLSDYSAEVMSYNITDDGMEVTVLNNSNSTWDGTNFIGCLLWINGADSGLRTYLTGEKNIAPGETVTFSFENVASAIDSADTVEIQMLQEGITYFGEKETIKSPDTVE